MPARKLWLDYLGQPEPGPAAAADALGHFPPWRATGSVAAARMRELSPQLIVRKHHPKRHQADVHEKLRSLIEQATAPGSLADMPPPPEARAREHASSTPRLLACRARAIGGAGDVRQGACVASLI